MISLILMMTVLFGQIAGGAVLNDANISILTQEQTEMLIQMKKSNPSTVLKESFQMWSVPEIRDQNSPNELISENYEVPLNYLNKDLVFPKLRWPNDVLIRERSEEPSIDRDSNGDLYVVFESPIDSGGYIYKSTNGGASWDFWFRFTPGGRVVEPSICVTATNIVVLYSMSSLENIMCFWRRKDVSDLGYLQLNGRWGESPSIDNPGPDVDHSVVAVHRGLPPTPGNNNIYLLFQFSNDGGETWSDPDTVIDATSRGVKCDGAITVAEQSGSYKTLIAYYTPLGTGSKDVYVLRSNPTGWDQVHQITGGTGILKYDPSIRALEYGNESSILLYYAEHTTSPSDWDLKFAYSYNTGDQGTWNSGHISDASFNQRFPHLGVGAFGHNYFYVSYWDWNDDNQAKVFGIYHYFSNISNYTIKRASRGNISLLREKVAVNWWNNATVPVVVWADRRTAYFNVYCNLADGASPGIKDSYSESHPNTVSLFQNYPNPVSSRTLMKYSLPQKSKVELKVYNASGREIATLLDKEQVAGSYKSEWDISNVSKKKLPNGVYFYRLNVGNFTGTKKMVIVR